MALLLGIDTGGTYTDAVLLDSNTRTILAKAKALTTHQQLDKGISEAIKHVLKGSSITLGDIGLVSVSTTLATNALVESVTRRIGAILIGFEKTQVLTPAMAKELAQDKTLLLSGGHNAHGEARTDLDEQALVTFLERCRTEVSAFSITSFFSVRNPEHELRAQELVEIHTGLPVTCSHALASSLNARERALTCVLNARLISLVSDFIQAIETSLDHYGIRAPLMIVKGDGSLISAASAKYRPIETAFSGPAASLVGTSYLASEPDAIIADIGGTTTDIAILQNGQPKLAEEGIRLAGWRTKVNAVEMRTHGLGGDSEVALTFHKAKASLTLGPRRVVPVSLFAAQYPTLVSTTLARQLEQEVPREFDGRFVVSLATSAPLSYPLSSSEKELLMQLQDGPKALHTLVQARRMLSAINRLTAQKLIIQVGFTPTDAAHVLSCCDLWDTTAARNAATLFARKRDKHGTAIAPDADALSQWVIDTLVRRSAEHLLDAALFQDIPQLETLFSSPSQHTLLASALEGHYRLTQYQIGLNLPVIGLGASAQTYYPAVGEKLATRTIIPEHAEVANAIGAVVGLVRKRVSILITQPTKEVYRIHHLGIEDITELDAALARAQTLAYEAACAQALQAGAADVSVETSWEQKRPVIDGEEMFVEARVTAYATGRPHVGLPA